MTDSNAGYASSETQAPVVVADTEKAPKPQAPDSDSEDENLSPEQKKVFGALEKVLDEWYMTGLPRAGAKSFIRKRIADGDDKTVARVRKWMLLRMNGRLWDHGMHLMCRTPENIPDLRGIPVWPRENLPWLEQISLRHAEIMEELLRVRSETSDGKRSGFQPYRDQPSGGNEALAAKDGVGVEAVDRGMWNVLYLYLNHKRFEENCARFPVTLKAIEESFPRQYSHAFFSALTPGSHILKHHGPSNRMLRVWLPICGLDGARLRVQEQIVEPKAGEAFAWDHSFEHEAWHDGPDTRIVLIVDVWHPDLADAEVNFLRTMQNCRLRAGKALAEQAQEQMQAEKERGEHSGENVSTYFDIVEKAKHLLTDDEWWVIKAELDPTTRPT
jgi:aspartate beta-hydroxylase